MKFVKLFFSVLFLLTFSLSSLTFAKTAPAPKTNATKDFSAPAASNYFVYQEINGVTWVIVYNDDGKEIDRYPLE
ncbi:MAG: hypothetical protein J0M18_17540 [Ignavibacteria bacterium]|nr:hypothetical protein [Ignavibacteria bacterium]